MTEYAAMTTISAQLSDLKRDVNAIRARLEDYEWAIMEAEAETDIAAGRVEQHDNVEGLIRSLHA